ncbi:MAG TPA: sensor histidine kinase, partial [Nitriliruptorales bacterium]|nr:sensor histidine kinase [Nitriliruptorales bacterium]
EQTGVPAATSTEETAAPERWDRSIQVTHQGAAIGEIAVRMPAGGHLSPGRERLLLDLAAQAGVALRHVALTSELQDRLEELSTQTRQLHASRQRLVAAQHQARRRMEREIHDGTQQYLVAMSMKLRLVDQLLDRDPDRAVALLDQLSGDANAALEGLRDLARGIYPPLLTDRGVLAALDAHVRKHGIPATIVAAPEFMAGRFPQPAEVAVYFCVLEALQNATRHAPGAQMTIRLDSVDGDLEFSVQDDGPGFDPSATARGTGVQHMLDRVEALGGSLSVDSVPGRGTVVRGRIPRTIAAASPR